LASEELDQMGPIDMVVIEFPDGEPKGEAAPLLVDLVDRGIIRILDLLFIKKNEDGSVTGVEIADLDGDGVPDLRVFEGASSGLLGDEDVQTAGEGMSAGGAALLLVFENSWAGPLASKLRKAGGQLVAFERIPVQSLLAALDEAEAAAASASG
jgi:uncharacterized membrane protein